MVRESVRDAAGSSLSISFPFRIVVSVSSRGFAGRLGSVCSVLGVQIRYGKIYAYKLYIVRPRSDQDQKNQIGNGAPAAVRRREEKRSKAKQNKEKKTERRGHEAQARTGRPSVNFI